MNNKLPVITENSYLEHMKLFSLKGTPYVVLADNKDEASIVSLINSIVHPRSLMDEINFIDKTSILLEATIDEIEHFRENIHFRASKRMVVKKGMYMEGNHLKSHKNSK